MNHIVLKMQAAAIDTDFAELLEWADATPTRVASLRPTNMPARLMPTLENLILSALLTAERRQAVDAFLAHAGEELIPCTCGARLWRFVSPRNPAHVTGLDAMVVDGELRPHNAHRVRS